MDARFESKILHETFDSRIECERRENANHLKFWYIGNFDRRQKVKFLQTFHELD